MLAYRRTETQLRQETCNKFRHRVTSNRRNHRFASMIDVETIRDLFLYDSASGAFIWRVRCGQRGKIGAVAGYITNKGYRSIKVRGNQVLAHRLAWAYVHGSWPQREIDHINGDPDDNRIANLRDVDRETNQQNIRRASVVSKTHVLGVSKQKNRFRARIRYAGKDKNLGSFKTPELAYQAYVAAKRALHAGCTI